MNRKYIAIAAMLVALELSAAAFTMPTRQASAWGSFGSTKVDQRINQLNKCTSQSPDNNYQQSSYDPNSDNKPTTDSSRSNSLNQTTSESHGNISSGEDKSDNNQPNSGSADEKHNNNNNHLVTCVNKANNLAQFN